MTLVATMADVARLAGVSKKTISNFFNGYPYMRPDTRARIEAAVAELNYKVNISARNLSSGRTGTVALVLPELAHPYFAELAQSVVSAASERGLAVLVEVTGGDHERELERLNGSEGRSVDGIIFGPIALDASEIDAGNSDVPLVLLGDRAHEGTFDFVGVPNYGGALEAVAYLLNRGRTRIVALGMEDAAAPTAAGQRHHGYLDAHAGAGMTAAPDLFVGPVPWNRASGADAIPRLMDSGVEFDAVFGFNDALALGAMSELQRLGIRVPEDVAVVGFDNVEEATYSSPGLTTIESGRDWIARRAVDILASRMADQAAGDSPPDAPQLVMASHRLIERDSA